MNPRTKKAKAAQEMVPQSIINAKVHPVLHAVPAKFGQTVVHCAVNPICESKKQGTEKWVRALSRFLRAFAFFSTRQRVRTVVASRALAQGLAQWLCQRRHDEKHHHKEPRTRKEATRNKCLTSSNKKLLGTSASLLETSALLVVTRTLRTGLLAVLLGTRSY